MAVYMNMAKFNQWPDSYDIDSVLDNDVWRMSSIQSFLICQEGLNQQEISSPFIELNSAIIAKSYAEAPAATVQTFSVPVRLQEISYNPRRTYRRLQGKLSEEQKTEHRRQQNRQAQERYRKRKSMDDSDLSS
mmetsp:Transcript_73760/g.196294  ORF Transcript_73760/g.196294 Transcript_73760/m.196294 type:complete len:133 (+) Transcript_73760:68-466(+)